MRANRVVLERLIVVELVVVSCGVGLVDLVAELVVGSF